MHSHPSPSSSAVHTDELQLPSMKPRIPVPLRPVLSSELTAKEQILDLGLVEIKRPKCMGHHVPRHATRSVQDEPKVGKMLSSVHILGPSQVRYVDRLYDPSCSAFLKNDDLQKRGTWKALHTKAKLLNDF